MAFTSEVLDRLAGQGSEMVVRGTYTNDGGSTGGDINTGLNIVRGFQIQPKAAAVIATQSVVNETFPLMNSNGAVTIVTSADEVGYWEAKGV